MTRSEWAFSGIVESINVKGRDTAASHQCLFALRPPVGASQPFLLDPFEVPARYAAMLQVLTTAYASGRTVWVNTLDGHVPPYVFEIETRAPAT